METTLFILGFVFLFACLAVSLSALRASARDDRERDAGVLELGRGEDATMAKRGRSGDRRLRRVQ